MSQAEMDAALDEVEKQHGLNPGEANEHVIGDKVEDDPQENPDTDDIDNIEEDEGTPKPPGFMGYEEYVAAGNDPKMYRGEDAYNAEYNHIQDNKAMRAQLDSLQQTMSQVVTVNEEWRTNQLSTMRSQVQHELDTAKEASDMQGALDAQKKLNELDNAPRQQIRQEQINPLITDFRSKNPVADRTSPRFNAEYTSDLETIYDGMLAKFEGSREGITDDRIKRCLAMAKKDANALHPNLFESPRNARQTKTKTQKRTGTTQSVGDYRTRLKGIGNSKNTRDSNAGVDMYDMILNKKGGGKDAADAFARANLGE